MKGGQWTKAFSGRTIRWPYGRAVQIPNSQQGAERAVGCDILCMLHC